MKDITHEILSEIHHLLSIGTEEELRRAGNLPNTSPHLRIALESLAAERRSTAKQEKPSSEERSRSRKLASSPGPDAQLSFNTLARDLVRTLDGLGKAEIQEACRSAGVPLSVKSKDSRERMIRRVAGLLTNGSGAERERFLAAIRVKSDPQTEGWVDVIRKGR